MRSRDRSGPDHTSRKGSTQGTRLIYIHTFHRDITRHSTLYHPCSLNHPGRLPKTHPTWQDQNPQTATCLLHTRIAVQTHRRPFCPRVVPTPGRESSCSAISKQSPEPDEQRTCRGLRRTLSSRHRTKNLRVDADACLMLWTSVVRRSWPPPPSHPSVSTALLLRTDATVARLGPS